MRPIVLVQTNMESEEILQDWVPQDMLCSVTLINRSQSNSVLLLRETYLSAQLRKRGVSFDLVDMTTHKYRVNDEWQSFPMICVLEPFDHVLRFV
jgi:hypothetical protein